jgi:acyl-CoA reductase-like NAD-dependent aldehyde dehydrogenase
VAAALERAGLPPGTVALLHDDRGGALRGALAEGALGWLRVRASGEALEGFAAGAGGTRERSLWPLANTSAVVLEGDDPARAAGALALKALGRSGTLSGQLPGQVGRVICHQRLFSRFSEEFLHGLEDGPVPALGPPVPAIEGDLPAYVRRAWALGLDEGATPIHGGEPLVRAAAAPGTAPGVADGPAPATEPDPAQARGRAPRVVLPVVFTNVEPGRRLARLRRPAPVVLLMRASSDEAARELAAELDRG